MENTIRSLLVLALVLTACSPSGSDATSTTAGATDVTSDAETTTTDAPAGTTTTVAAETTTTQASLGADATVAAKTAAVEAAIPDGWAATTGAAVTDQEADESFCEPFDRDVADTLFEAAVNA